MVLVALLSVCCFCALLSFLVVCFCLLADPLDLLQGRIPQDYRNCPNCQNHGQNSSVVDAASLLTEQPEQRMSFGDERMLEAFGATPIHSEGADRDDDSDIWYT